MRRFVTNLLTRDLERSIEFYKLLCGMRQIEQGETYALLGTQDEPQLAIIDWVSELVPRAARGIAEGTYLSLVVDSVDAALIVARDFGVEVIEETRRDGGTAVHAVIRDLDGRVIELATPAAYLVLPPQQTVA